MHTYHSTTTFETLLTIINKYTNCNLGRFFPLVSPKGVSLILTAMCVGHKVCYGGYGRYGYRQKLKINRCPFPLITKIITPATMSRITVKVATVDTVLSPVTCVKVYKYYVVLDQRVRHKHRVGGNCCSRCEGCE